MVTNTNKTAIENVQTMTKKQSESQNNFLWNVFAMRVRESRLWIRLAIALTIVIAAVAVRLVFLRALEFRAPYTTFYPAVMIATLFCGFSAGILAIFLSALMVIYFWIESVN